MAKVTEEGKTTTSLSLSEVDQKLWPSWIKNILTFYIFSLNYHLIFVTKYRRKVINDKTSNRLLEIFKYIGNKYHMGVLKKYIESQGEHA